jgi:hypothetical protein
MTRVPVGHAPPSRALPDLIVAALTGSGHPLGTRSIRRRVNRMLAELHDGVGIPWQVTSVTVAEALDRERGRRFLRIDEYTWRLLGDEMAEMASVGPPWDDQPSAQVILEALAQTTVGRRAILRDAFPMLVEAARGIQPLVARTLETVARQVDEHAAEQRSDVAPLLGRADSDERPQVESPTPTATGQAGNGVVPEPRAAEDEPAPGVLELMAPTVSETNGRSSRTNGASPSPVGEPGEHPFSPRAITSPPSAPPPSRRTSLHLPPLVPDPRPGTARSRFDARARVALYNDRHPDYLLVKDDEPALLDYLAMLAAKEHAVQSHPGASSDELAEEMVRVLVCIRHHLSSAP